MIVNKIMFVYPEVNKFCVCWRETKARCGWGVEMDGRMYSEAATVALRETQREK